ncbi:MAG: DUF4290 domain-containing protein [Bacteroidales bacterium]|nr:DUF4290 domain-containing protein [Bacteroidales bacterium]
MEYNTTREKLIIREYGRNIQKMVQDAVQIENREARTKFANVIVRIMGQMNPNAKDTADFRHKLWDHIHIISDFKLDVDSPYPCPSPKIFSRKPEKVSYGSNHIRFRHYGANIVKMIETVSEREDGPEKDALILAIANHMKKSFLHWNREAVEDDLILQHLELLAGGRIKPNKEETTLSSTNTLMGKKKNKVKKKPEPKNQKRRIPGRYHN